MRITVEPEDGPALDRLVTALLNATGVVHGVIVSAAQYERAGDTDPAAVIASVADCLQRQLGPLGERRADPELEAVTQALAEATLLIAGVVPASRSGR